MPVLLPPAAFSNLTDGVLTGVAQGDILYRGPTAWNNLAHGSAGQILTTQGVGASPIWANIGPGVGAVVTAPASSVQNTIQPTSATVVPLTLQGAAGQTADYLHSIDASNNLKWKVDSNGTVTTSADQLHPISMGYNGGVGAVVLNFGDWLFYRVGAQTALLSVSEFRVQGFITLSGNSDNIQLTLTGNTPQTNPLLCLNQISSTSATRAVAVVDGVFVVSTDATRQGRLVLSAVDYNATREGLRIEANGTAPAIGFLGGTAVVQQANASQAAITAVTDANAKSALQAIYNLLHAYNLAPATA